MQMQTMAAMVLLGLLGGSSIARAQGEQLFKLLPTDGAATDILGLSVEIGGAIAIGGRLEMMTAAPPPARPTTSTPPPASNSPESSP